MQQLNYNNKKIRLGKSKKISLLILLVVIFLFSLHLFNSHKHASVLKAEYHSHSPFYVLSSEGYKTVSFGMDDLFSRMIVLYALFAPQNTNIPSINFERLNRALEGSVALDPKNIQPYLHTAYYWSWAKDEESRAHMAKFMETGINLFPKVWDIPYSVYTLKRDIDPSGSLKYLKMAAERAAEFGGPDWIIDYPAVIMTRDDELLEALLWLEEIYSKTVSEKQRLLIIEQMEKIAEELEKRQNK